VNTRQVRSNRVRRLGWTWAAVLILLASTARTGFASARPGGEAIAAAARHLPCQEPRTGYWMLLPVEALEADCGAYIQGPVGAATKTSAPKTRYQVLPDRFWEYSFAELGQHMNQVVYLDEATSEPAGTVAVAPKTRYQVLPDRFWEYSFAELGQHMNQIVWLEEK
jgi:hypothetical protein